MDELHNFEVLRHHDADEVVVDMMDVVDDPIDVVVALYNTADIVVDDNIDSAVVAVDCN